MNFLSAGNVQLGVAGNVQLKLRASLCPDLGEAAAEQAQALLEGRVMAQLNRSQELTFIKPGLVLATLSPRTLGIPGCASSWGCGKCSLLCPQWQKLCLAQDRYSRVWTWLSCRKWSPNSTPCLCDSKFLIQSASLSSSLKWGLKSSFAFYGC